MAFAQRVDGLIRKGDFRRARDEIRDKIARKSSRTEALQIANFARRAGWPSLAVRLLAPYVRPQGRKAFSASNEERMEYAAALIRIGASTEALELLGSLSEPEAHLYRAFAHIHQWDYAGAIPPLRVVIESEPSPDYLKLVAKVNLAAAYVQTGDWVNAKVALTEVRLRSEAEGNLLLLGNALELSAQSAIGAGELDAAEADLRRARQLMLERGRAEGSVDSLYVKKWEALLGLKRSPESGAALRALGRVQEKARALGEAETIRDCDFHLAVFLNDEATLAKLFFGTPYRSFRDKILAHSKFIPEEFVFSPDRKRHRILDLARGEFDEALALKFQQVPHRLLLVLAADLYKPRRLPEIFGHLFSDRYFDLESSPALVHQALKRLRMWLVRNSVGLEIREKNGAYSLAVIGCALRYSSSSTSKLAHQMEVLRRNKPAVFTAREAALVLGISKRSSINMLNEATREALINRSGSGPRVVYYWK